GGMPMSLGRPPVPGQGYLPPISGATISFTISTLRGGSLWTAGAISMDLRLAVNTLTCLTPLRTGKEHSKPAVLTWHCCPSSGHWGSYSCASLVGTFAI